MQLFPVRTALCSNYCQALGKYQQSGSWTPLWDLDLNPIYYLTNVSLHFGEAQGCYFHKLALIQNQCLASHKI